MDIENRVSKLESSLAVVQEKIKNIETSLSCGEHSKHHAIIDQALSDISEKLDTINKDLIKIDTSTKTIETIRNKNLRIVDIIIAFAVLMIMVLQFRAANLNIDHHQIIPNQQIETRR